MKNSKFIYKIDELSPRSPLMQPIFYELYSFEEHVPNWFTIGLNGEYVGNDKTPFVDNPDYLCIGCSFTSGEGIPELYSWPSIIRQFTGKTVNNCSMRGAGPTWLAYAALDVMKAHGSPKEAFALFPDLERALVYEWAETENSFGQKFTGRSYHSYWSATIGAFTNKKQNGALEILEIKDFQGKKYHLPLELVILQSFFMIDMIDSHFEILKVPFKFSAWPPHVYEAFERLKDKYPSFLESAYWRTQIETSTKHKDDWNIIDSSTNEMARGLWRRFGCSDSDDATCSHEPQTDSQFRFWCIAADDHHPGLHDQIHLAEYFLGQSIGNDFLKEIP